MKLISNFDIRIIQLMANGLTMKEIASILDHPISTIDTYRFRIYKKLQVKNAPECVAFALRNHLIS